MCSLETIGHADCNEEIFSRKLYRLKMNSETIFLQNVSFQLLKFKKYRILIVKLLFSELDF